jgi:hypothetical protein
VRRLVSSPDEAVRYLGARLSPVPAADEKRLARLIADLDSDRFAVRARAAKELEGLGELAVGACRKALTGKLPLEGRRRLEALVETQEQMWRAPSPERLRTLRALETLERVGTPAARGVLTALAGGAPGARLTREAAASVRRLSGRGKSG